MNKLRRAYVDGIIFMAQQQHQHRLTSPLLPWRVDFIQFENEMKTETDTRYYAMAIGEAEAAAEEEEEEKNLSFSLTHTHTYTRAHNLSPLSSIHDSLADGLTNFLNLKKMKKMNSHVRRAFGIVLFLFFLLLHF